MGFRSGLRNKLIAEIDLKTEVGLTRFYYTASGAFLLLSACEDDIARLDGVPGLKGIAEVAPDHRNEFLAHAFMADLGYTEDEIAEMLRDVTISASLSREYLPS